MGKGHKTASKRLKALKTQRDKIEGLPKSNGRSLNKHDLLYKTGEGQGGSIHSVSLPGSARPEDLC